MINWFEIARVFSCTEVQPTGCILWIGSTELRGHGTISVDGKMWKAHRYIMHLIGRLDPSIGDGIVLHKCGNAACVNPGHLEMGTYAENNNDTIAHGRNYWLSQTHCINGHEWNAENTRIYRKQKTCRLCGRMKAARYRAKRKK